MSDGTRMNANEDRPLPNSHEMEQRVLGAIIAGSKGAAAVVDRLEVDNFLYDAHRAIYEAIRALPKHDLPLVVEELRRTSRLDAAGGAEYVASLIDGIPHITHVDLWAGIVRGYALIRQAMHAAKAIEERGYDAGDPNAYLDEAIEMLSTIARKADQDREETTGFRDAGLRLMEQYDVDTGLRVYTDIDELDRLIGGFRPGELVILTAETGVGKTLLAQQTRRRACRDGRHGLYASGEMLAPHLVSRELATEAGVKHFKMRRDDCLTPSDRQALIEALSKECNRCRILDGELSLAKIRRTARQMKARGDLDFVILDYDELIEAPGREEFEQQKNLVRGAKSIAIESKIPVLVISQLRKALQGEDREHPTLQRLYGSGAKPKHASIVIYVDRQFVRELDGDETQARIVILKNRDGQQKALPARFNVRTLRFEGESKPIPEQPHWVTH